MSRNAESRFSTLPEVDIQRSKFKRPSSHKTTFNVGELIPIFVDEVLPGDTFSMTTNSLVRMSTPIFPVMDNCYLDTFYFFVPNRLLWEHWKEFNGENSQGYWAQTVDYVVPQLKTVTSEDGTVGFDKGSIGDYFCLPTNVEGLSVNALPFRAYTLIWNEFFRDQNTMPPAYFTKSDIDYDAVAREDVKGYGFEEILSNAIFGARPLPVSKFHDYFTSCLPSPQKGPSVDLPLYQDSIPVFSGPLNDRAPSDYPLTFNAVGGLSADYGSLGFSDIGSHTLKLSALDSQTQPQFLTGGFAPNNLYADVSNVAVATISQLRQAFQLQRLFEKDARGGKNSLCLHVKKIAEKIWKAFLNWLIRGEGFNQPQRIGNEIIFPRGRDTFLVKRYAKLY